MVEQIQSIVKNDLINPSPLIHRESKEKKIWIHQIYYKRIIPFQF